MSGREYIEHLRKAGTAKLRNERGVSMLEYTFLIALIGVILVGILSFLGGWTNDELGVGGLSIRYGDYVAGECPDGSWDLTHIDDAPVKNGPDPNQNGDDYVCVKNDVGSGNGNSGQNANNKDNGVDPVDNG
jgi:Flp pilus assembly pilin Flp